jgi:hypothetical protein
MSIFDTGIIPQTTIEQMINAYNQCTEEMQEGFQLLADAEKRLRAAFGSSTGYTSFSVIERTCYWNCDRADEFTREQVKRLKIGAWERIIDAAGIRKLMSKQRAEELDRKLKVGEMPDVTVEEVWILLQAFTQNAAAIQDELFAEVYDFLRPGTWDHYKTNKRYEIGRKVILSGMVDSSWAGGFSVSYYHDSKFIRLDRVFHLLDGKGIPSGYRSPLVDAINTCKGGAGETEYFKFHCYQNRNLHLEFKRLDLLAEFNARCGGLTLRGE